MRILIIEDEIIIARFIENQLKDSFSVDTSIALNLQEAEKQLKTFLPHLVLCDIELNEQLDGIDLMHKLTSNHNFELVFITSYQSKSMIDRASELKPANYIIKPLDECRLYAGILPVIKEVKNRLCVERKLNLGTLLSPIEMQVLQLVAQKKTTKEIANLLFLSPLTIKNHRHGICRKLCLKVGNNALLMWALKNQDSIKNATRPPLI